MDRRVYCSEVFQVVPARPSGKGRLPKQGKYLSTKECGVVGHGLFGAISRGKKLRI